MQISKKFFKILCHFDPRNFNYSTHFKIIINFCFFFQYKIVKMTKSDNNIIFLFTIHFYPCIGKHHNTNNKQLKSSCDKLVYVCITLHHFKHI